MSKVFRRTEKKNVLLPSIWLHFLRKKKRRRIIYRVQSTVSCVCHQPILPKSFPHKIDLEFYNKWVFCWNFFILSTGVEVKKFLHRKWLIRRAQTHKLFIRFKVQSCVVNWWKEIVHNFSESSHNFYRISAVYMRVLAATAYMSTTTTCALSVRGEWAPVQDKNKIQWSITSENKKLRPTNAMSTSNPYHAFNWWISFRMRRAR